MLDIPPPYSPSSHTPSRSYWTLVPNWVWTLSSVADTPRQDVAVAVEDLRPRACYVRTTLAAINDIRFCEKIFSNWMTELGKVTTTSSKKADEREELLRFYLECLKKYAGLCSNATNEILGCHVRFASLMAQRIDGASESQNNLRYDYSETTRLANGISAAADELSTYVTKTIDNLNSFVSVLEEVQVTVKKGSLVESVKNILRWIWGWLKYLAEAIARIPSAKPRGEIPLSTLEEGAARYCPADLGPQEGNESERLESAILFLKGIVPKEARNAQKNLKRFDGALHIMGLESHMKEGRRVTLFGRDPAAVAREWRDVAEKYESAIRIGSA